MVSHQLPGTISTLAALPSTAAWQHLGLRDGFEVAHFATSNSDGSTRIWGNSLATEGVTSYAVTYRIVVDEKWNTREATIETRTRDSVWTTQLARNELGSWSVNVQDRPDLLGCIDIDLEASVVTNTLPIHRLTASPGHDEVDAVYVRASEPLIEVLPQTYAIPAITTPTFSCDYTAPRFEFAAKILYDHAGLVLEYPDLATRIPRS